MIAFNRPVDEETAKELKDIFLEIVIAPSFTPEAKAVLSSAKRLLNIRLLEVDMSQPQGGGYDLRRVRGGMLLQDWDTGTVDMRACKVVTERKPTRRRISGARFRLAGLPPCEVEHDCFRFAGSSARRRRRPDEPHRFDQDRGTARRDSRFGPQGLGRRIGCFYPFRDGLDEAANAGAKSVIQPGGSIKDDEVIAAANEHGIAMIFTGMRHFRH